MCNFPVLAALAHLDRAGVPLKEPFPDVQMAIYSRSSSGPDGLSPSPLFLSTGSQANNSDLTLVLWSSTLSAFYIQTKKPLQLFCSHSF